MNAVMGEARARAPATSHNPAATRVSQPGSFGKFIAAMARHDTAAQISKELGVSQNTVYYRIGVLRKDGVMNVRLSSGKISYTLTSKGVELLEKAMQAFPELGLIVINPGAAAEAEALQESIRQAFIDRKAASERIRALDRRGNYEETEILQRQLEFDQADLARELRRLKRVQASGPKVVIARENGAC